jgi:hypothetical protein
MMNMRGVGFAGPGLDPERKCKMAVRELTEELADYFQVIHKELPNARLGVIESLGYFQVQVPGGKKYLQNDRRLPNWPFADYFDDLLRAMRQRGLALDHFHIDFGFHGVKYDGRLGAKLDFGRVLAVENYVQSKGVKSGVIVNATLDRDAGDLPREAANREVGARALRFFEEYAAAGGRADHIVFQWWHAYPDRTGPESRPFTALHIARQIIDSQPQAKR